MSKDSSRKWYLIYSENDWKDQWDIFISFVLIFSCIVIPYQIAFKTIDNSKNLTTAILVADVFFLIDIVLNFLTVVHDDDHNEIDDVKIIARSYLFGWFFIDVVAIFPVEFILQS